MSSLFQQTIQQFQAEESFEDWAENQIAFPKDDEQKNQSVPDAVEEVAKNILEKRRILPSCQERGHTVEHF